VERNSAVRGSTQKFSADWDDGFDDLRVRPRKRGEQLADWWRNAPTRSIDFQPPILSDGRDASDVVQVNL
jgi:hypothetical protein